MKNPEIPYPMVQNKKPKTFKKFSDKQRSHIYDLAPSADCPMAPIIFLNEEEQYCWAWRYVVYESGKSLPIYPNSGKRAFFAHTTHGYPVGLTRQELYEMGWALDEHQFRVLMEEEKARGRAAWRAKKR